MRVQRRGHHRPAAAHGSPARGIARSFQIVRLFRNLTVRENVEARRDRARPGPAARRGRLADGAARRVRPSQRADDFAGSLSYGDERRVEIARALAAAPTFLLLDEPAAGMNEAETERLLALLAALPEAQSLGLLIIDHDMPLIMRCAIACTCWLPAARSPRATSRPCAARPR